MSGILKYTKIKRHINGQIFVNQAKRSLCFDLSVTSTVVFVCLSACLSDNYYGHTHFPIIIKFGINVLDTKAKQNMCQNFYPPPYPTFKMAVILGYFIQLRSNTSTAVMKFGPNALGTKVELSRLYLLYVRIVFSIPFQYGDRCAGPVRSYGRTP